MKKNRIKDFLNISRIIILILAIILLKIHNYTLISIILIIVVIILSTIERIFWRCKKCKSFLPAKSLFDIITYCPYCKSNIEGDNDE